MFGPWPTPAGTFCGNLQMLRSPSREVTELLLKIFQISICFYYLKTGWYDTWRAFSQLFVNSVIVVGICLPLLVICGLKRGLVAQFQQDLLKSPTARRVSISVLSQSGFLDRAMLDSLQTQVPGVFLAVPSVSRPVNLTNGSNNVAVTIESTRPGNPFLAFMGLDLLEDSENSVILSTHAAKKLGIDYSSKDEKSFEVKPNQSVNLSLSRQSEPDKVFSVALVVRGVYSSGSSESMSGFADFGVLDKIEDFIQGRSVPSWNWPSASGNPPPRYTGYIAFCQEDYRIQDLQRLHSRGFSATRFQNDLPGITVSDRLLGGVLYPHQLSVYKISPGGISGSGGESDIGLTAAEIMEITEADDVAFPWCPPTELLLDGVPHRVVGITGALKWLRAYFRNLDFRIQPPESNGEMVQMQVLAPLSSSVSTSQAVKIGFGIRGNVGTFQQIPVKPGMVESLGPKWRALEPKTAATLLLPMPPAHLYSCLLPAFLVAEQPEIPSNPPLAIVSAEIASNIYSLSKGRLDFDMIGNRFVVPAMPNRYTSAAIYADDVNHVPAVDNALKRLGYGTDSSRTRVEEIQRYTGTLDSLVLVVSVAVGVFGLLTMGFVFWELTSRKSGAIGVMRVMGVSSLGVAIILLVRAVAVGVFGFLLSVILSQAAGFLLVDGFGIACHYEMIDYVILFGVSVGCCLLGVSIPAWYFSSWLDPVDALMSSKLL